MPPSRRPAPRGHLRYPGAAPGNARLLTVFALALLAAIAFGVVFVLPGVMEPAQAPPQSARSSSPVAAKRSEGQSPRETAARDTRTSGPGREQREAERILGQVLRQQVALESLDVAGWAGEAYASTLDALEGGDTLFGEGAFVDAAQAYQRVLDHLRALEGSMPQRHAVAMERGTAALARFDGAGAEAQFAIALAINPDDAVARRGLARAANIDEVAALIEAGRAHEAAGALAEAGRAYRGALDLDPEVGEARSAHDRVQAHLEAETFQRTMSGALAAMERGDLDAARESLNAAVRLRPGSKAVRDVRTELEARRQARRIAAHRRRAETFAAQERWREAVAQYQAVLDIDPQVAFAVDGRARAETLERIHRQLDVYVAEPERLASQRPLEDAQALVRAARNVGLRGPELERKLGSLRELIAQASTPVPVTLSSDGQTEVTVYKLGRLGRFETHRVWLRPGRYTVVGIRPGYRDVRREFEVSAGGPPRPIEVRCEEPI